MSTSVLDGILRQRMKFDGVIVSDDLEMKAIAANFDIAEVVTRGANAGVDLFAICHDPDLQNRAIDALIRAVERGEVSRERVAEANRRLDALIGRYARGAHPISDFNPLNSRRAPGDHRAIAAVADDHGDATMDRPTRCGLSAEQAVDKTATRFAILPPFIGGADRCGSRELAEQREISARR